MDDKIKEIEKNISEIYLMLNSLNEFVKSQVELNKNSDAFYKNVTNTMKYVDDKVSFVKENLLSTIKHNNAMHEMQNNTNESNRKMFSTITSMLRNK